MQYGSVRVIVRCGSDERRIELAKLPDAVEEISKTSPPGSVIQVLRFGVVKG